MNWVPAIAQDRAGFLWVATAQGLTRYGGYRLRPVELPPLAVVQHDLGWVRALAPGADERIWIGCATGRPAFGPSFLGPMPPWSSGRAAVDHAFSRLAASKLAISRACRSRAR